MKNGKTPKRVSVVIPAYNEEGSIVLLLEGIQRAFTSLHQKLHEIIVVDDGSTDGTWDQLETTENNRPEIPLKAVRLRKNFGKANALDLGFSLCTGDLVVTMDGDLQDDPEEIGRLLEKLESGYDLVSGWKAQRQDPLGKTLPSKLFNLVTAIASGVHIHDFNCGFKAYRVEVVRAIRLQGEMHRYIPVLANAQGFSVTELPVKHHPRTRGVSKYGLERLPRGLIDLFTVLVMTRFLARPAHFFGGLGLMLVLAGLCLLSYLAVIWFISEQAVGTRPLLSLGMLCTLSGAQLVCFGLLAELFLRRQGVHTAQQVVEKLGGAEAMSATR